MSAHEPFTSDPQLALATGPSLIKYGSDWMQIPKNRIPNPYRAYLLESINPALEAKVQEVVSLDVESAIEHDPETTTPAYKHKDPFRLPYCKETLQAFAEGSHGFALLSQITADCRERKKLLLAYQLAVSIYEYVCLIQFGIFCKHNVTEISQLKQLYLSRFHKGHLLYQIAQIAHALGWHWHTDYYLALTLAEDILTCFVCQEKDDVDGVNKDHSPDKWQTQFRFFWERTGVCEWMRDNYGFNQEFVERIVRTALLKQIEPGKQNIAFTFLFPEWSAGVFDCFGGKYRAPTPEEIRRNPFNRVYWGALSHLLLQDADTDSDDRKIVRQKKGYVFEEACRYLCSTVPGVRVRRDGKGGNAGQVDLIGFVDSHSRFVHEAVGSDFVAECKWWRDSPGVQEAIIAGARAQQVRCKTFLFFSKTGLSGVDGNTDKDADLQLQLLAGQFGIIGTDFNSRNMKIDEAKDSMDHLLGEQLASITDVHNLPPVLFTNVLRDEYERSKFRIYHRSAFRDESGSLTD